MTIVEDKRYHGRRLMMALLMITMALPALPQRGKGLAVAFTGDILLDRGVRERIEADGVEALFTPRMDSLLKSADFVVGNLECPATDIHAPVLKKFIFRAEPKWLNTLRRHGFTHLNLANNHSVDQGRRGLMSTIGNIRKYGMVPVGAGRNMDEAARPVLVADKPRKVFLLTSVTIPLENFPLLRNKPSPSRLQVESLCDSVTMLKKRFPGSCVVVNLHWGAEHTLKPKLVQRRDARRIIDAGADAVIGHHTHTLQSSEYYKGKPIFYSIGNFIFDLHNEVNRRGAVVMLYISKNRVETEQHGYIIKKCTPYLQ